MSSSFIWSMAYSSTIRISISLGSTRAHSMRAGRSGCPCAPSAWHHPASAPSGRRRRGVGPVLYLAGAVPQVPGVAEVAAVYLRGGTAVPSSMSRFISMRLKAAPSFQLIFRSKSGPLSAIDTQSLPDTMMWSARVMFSILSRFFKLRVVITSASDGSAMPLGWLCAR